MSNSAVSGHGATFAITLDPVNSASTYTSVAEITSDIMHEYKRDSEGHAAHADTVVSYIMDGAFDQSEIPLTCNFIYNNSTHDHTTGVQSIFKAGTLIGFRLRSPLGTTDTNEVIGSCFVSSFKRTFPNRTGAQSAEIGFRPSGTFKIDGVTF
jgi:hypothetical protein